MAATRRDRPPLSVWLPPQSTSPSVLPDLPPISALFLIDFDVKAGYTIVWKQAVPGLELEGVVEYKSLPSGLHTVPEDLIYFVHDGGHAGLSAFINTPTDEEETRHARMIAVGVLVPLSYGRLGRAWRHAEGLKEMASELVADRSQTHMLEEYWQQHGIRDPSVPQPLQETALDSPALSFKGVRPGLGKGHARNRSASDGNALIQPGNRLSPYHPAWSLTSLLHTFGPLIFPIHRAALLRKRILISTHAPVHEACNFVYDLSILSNIPHSVSDVVDPSASVQRLRPLFNIGVHDISYLLEHQAALKRQSTGQTGSDAASDNEAAALAEERNAGWVACTTDSILAIKDGLWDMLITMPPPHSSNARVRVWPTVECPKGVPVKATQRDLRRFRSLCVSLARLAGPAASQQHKPAQHTTTTSPSTSATTTETTPATPATGTIRLSSSVSRPGTSAASGTGAALVAADAANDGEADKVVEPMTWAALAYSGFMWWASAGEQAHSDEVEESAHDSALLADFIKPSITMPQRRLSAVGQGEPSATTPRIRRRTNTAGEGEAAAVDSQEGQQPIEGEEEEESEEDRARIELAIIAYFHRLTTTMLSVLADVVDSADDDDMLDVANPPGRYSDNDGTAAASGGGDDDSRDRLLGDVYSDEEQDENDENIKQWVRVDSDALAHMGLDVWSQSDADFVRDLVARYFGDGKRKAYVETKGVEVCGLRVC